MKRGKPLLPDTLVPSWFVIQLLGTLLVAATLVTAREPAPWPWVCYGACALSWLGFVGTNRWRPRLSAALLGVATAFPAAALGVAHDSSAIILTVVTLGRFATLVTCSVTAIVGVTALDMAVAAVPFLLGTRGGAAVLVDIAVIFGVLLLGINRRQYEVRSKQAEELLAQTRRAQEEHARAATLDERTRIARELHDVLAHSLGALGVQLELAEALLAEKSDVDRALATVRRSRALALNGLFEARAAVAALRQDVPSMPDALAELVRVHARDHRTRVDFSVEGEPRPLPAAAAVSLVRTAREAITNAAKHAPGLPVTLALEFSADAVRLLVSNELPAVAEPAPEAGGFGLAGMRERLALAGGTLTAGAEGGSWRVLAEVRR